MMVITGLVRRVRWLVLATAEVTAAAATTATVATGDDTADQDKGLARRRRDHEVCVDILFAKLFGDVQPKRAVVVVDVSFGQITEDGMCSVDFFELVCCFWVVGVLVWVIFEGKFPVCLLDIVCGGGFGQP